MFEARINHVNDRAKERYGTELTEDEQAEIGKLIRQFERIRRKKCVEHLVKTDNVEKITSSTRFWGKKLSQDRDIYCVNYKNKQFFCVYDSTDNMLVTVLERYMVKNSLRLIPPFRGIVIKKRERKSKDWQYINYQLSRYKNRILHIRREKEVCQVPVEEKVADNIEIGQEVVVETTLNEVLSIEIKPAKKARNKTEIFREKNHVFTLAMNEYQDIIKKVTRRAEKGFDFSNHKLECTDAVFEKVKEQLIYDEFQIMEYSSHGNEKNVRIQW
jgi:hypothetical protein